jgi:hypothetical protein
MAARKVRQQLQVQKQLFFVAGHLSEPVAGSTSWTFDIHADDGDEAVRRAKAIAARYQQTFIMELCVYARGPRIKRGVASYDRISS